MAKRTSDKARQIAADLAGLVPQDAAAVLARAQLLVLGIAPPPASTSTGPTAPPINPNLIRRPKNRSIIGRDSEIVAFLDGLKRFYTLDELVELLRVTFGPRRGLSRSSLHRYIQHRTREARGKQRKTK